VLRNVCYSMNLPRVVETRLGESARCDCWHLLESRVGGWLKVGRNKKSYRESRGREFVFGWLVGSGWKIDL
jgi:hypothetical protein